MRVQQTQNQNFGAIKITGLKASSEAHNRACGLARIYNEVLTVGQERSGKIKSYIATTKGSEKETTVIAALRKLIGDQEGVKIDSCKDMEYSKNHKRLFETNPIKRFFM
jgi:hypothetical protein